jgi:hypothetical protein
MHLGLNIETTEEDVLSVSFESPIFDELYTQKDDRGEVWYHAAQWLTRQVNWATGRT